MNVIIVHLNFVVLHCTYCKMFCKILHVSLSGITYPLTMHFVWDEFAVLDASTVPQNYEKNLFLKPTVFNSSKTNLHQADSELR
jgi:hypothetical protein